MKVLPPLAGVPPPAPPPAPRGARPWTQRLAALLDSSIGLPGTSFRLGLDPLLGLIPGIGDALAALLGSALLAEALYRGVPPALLGRLAGNLLLNALLGAIPGLGDLFSAWFKSNTRNYALLNAFLQNHPLPPPSPPSRGLAFGLVGFVVLLAAGCGAIAWLLFRAAARLFS